MQRYVIAVWVELMHVKRSTGSSHIRILGRSSPAMSMLEDARDVAFAKGALRTFAHLTGVAAEDAYDRLLEAARHSLLFLDTCVVEANRKRMRPILDLLTALQVDADLPVGTGVMRAYTFGLQSGSDWRTHRPEDHVIVLRAVPTLRLLNRGTGPFSDAFLFVMHICRMHVTAA